MRFARGVGSTSRQQRLQLSILLVPLQRNTPPLVPSLAPIHADGVPQAPEQTKEPIPVCEIIAAARRKPVLQPPIPDRPRQVPPAFSLEQARKDGLVVAEGVLPLVEFRDGEEADGRVEGVRGDGCVRPLPVDDGGYVILIVDHYVVALGVCVLEVKLSVVVVIVVVVVAVDQGGGGGPATLGRAGSGG